METFFDIIILSVISLSLSVNLSMSKKISNLEKENEFFKANFLTTFDDIDQTLDRVETHVKKLVHQMDALPDVVKDDNHRSLQSLRESLETAKPIKPNNWDSVKEAFKGPAKVINERD